MTNTALIERVETSTDATNTERELADRLQCCINEMELLVQTVRSLELEGITDDYPGGES